MGIFGKIADAVNDAKERAYQEAQPAIQKMEQRDMYGAARVLHQEMQRSSSIAKKSYLTSAFKKKVSMSSSDDIYQAFDEMYTMYKYKGDTLALNISQILGKRLSEKNDSRITETESGDRTLYVPRGNF